MFSSFPIREKEFVHRCIIVMRLGVCQTYTSRLDFCPSLKKQASCLFLQSRLRSLSPPSMAAFLRYCSALSSGRLRSLPPPSMAAFLRYRSALSSGGESMTRLPEASLLLVSSGPPSFASAALHGGFSSLSLSALFGRRVYDSPPRSKPPACFFRAAFVRFRRPPWRLFLAIARHSLRYASP